MKSNKSGCQHCRIEEMNFLQIAGIWHTGVVVDGREYFFGQGIHECPAGCSAFGAPLEVHDLGCGDIILKINYWTIYLKIHIVLSAYGVQV